MCVCACVCVCARMRVCVCACVPSGLCPGSGSGGKRGQLLYENVWCLAPPGGAGLRLHAPNTEGWALSLLGSKIPHASAQLRVHMSSCSVMSNSATPWTAGGQAPLSMGFSGKNPGVGFAIPSPGDLPDPGIEGSSAASKADSLPLSHLGSLNIYYTLGLSCLFLSSPEIPK